MKSVVLNPFAFRQFEEDYTGSKVLGINREDFVKIVNERYDEQELKDGYAPFCKHLFLENDFTQTKVGAVKITPENKHLLLSDYVARKDGELAVLTRWFGKGSVTLNTAKFLDIILYSKEQILKEDKATGDTSTLRSIGGTDYDWGIVAIKGQDVAHELPMAPITAMRNALGKEQGGSGVPLDPKAYAQSVAYWKDHASVL